MKFGSCMHLSKVTQVCSNQGCMTYFHRIMLMSFWVVSYNIVFIMFYYMSLRNILFLTSLKPLHGFASNFVLMFLRWAPSNIVKIGVLSLFFMELLVILCNFWPILKKIFNKNADQKSFIFGLESPQETLFLVCDNSAGF